MSTGLATLASAGRTRSQRGLRLGRERRQLETRRLAGVRAEDAEPARVRDHRDSPPRRQRLRREQGGCVDQLLERPRADHARLVEERLDRRLGARQRRRMRARRPRAGRGRPALHRQDRFLARDAAGDPPEPARIAERLQVERDQPGVRVVLPVLEQVVGGDVGLVADRDEGGQADPPLLRLLQQREPERAALGGEGDRAGRQRARPERRVQPRRRDGEAEAVRPDEPSPVGSNQREELVLTLAPFVADLGEAGRDHADRARAGAERLLDAGEHVARGQADDGQIRRLGQVADRPVALDAGNRRLRLGSPGRPRPRTRPRRCFGRAGRRSTPCRRDAPSTATLEGAKNGLSDATAARWSRSSTRSRYVAVGSIRNSTSTVPPSSLRVLSKPTASKTLSICLFSGSTSATKRSIPTAAARAASCSSRRVPIPRRWSSSATRKATSAAAGVAEPHVAGEGDDAAAQLPDEMASLVPVGVDERLDEAARSATESRESGSRGSARTDRSGTRAAQARRRRAADADEASSRPGG